MTTRLPGFYRLGIAERRRRVTDLRHLDPGKLAAIDPGALSVEAADGMIENVIGTYALPFAVAVNFTVDGIEALVPMAIEEPSVVAAASHAARLARPGGFTTELSPPMMIGQIQVTHVDDVEAGAASLRDAADSVLDDACALVPRLTERGGGPRALEVRVLASSGPDGGMLVAHLHVDCRDAMGANLVNTLCEALADRVARLAGGRPGLRILSNLSDGRIVRARCRISDASFGEHGAEIRGAIAAASRFAELDPYRAATHNKGVMNGVDAFLVATGQDWRAVEAGAHAWAARSGRYQPLATWREHDGAQVSGSDTVSDQARQPSLAKSDTASDQARQPSLAKSDTVSDQARQPSLVGELAMPLAVGTVGGALHTHPSAKLALELAGVTHADRLAALAAAAGLATNLAALRALATEGIQRGHMALHARGLARAAGATGDTVERVAAELAASGDIKLERAREVLARLHAHAKESSS